MTVEYYRAALFFTTALICLLLAVAAWAQPAPPPRPQFVAVDGDTVRLGEERIRVMGLDAPEITTLEECKDPLDTKMVYWQGLAAMGYLQQILNRPGLEVVRTKHLDQYGRTLAFFRTGGKDVAKMMVEERLARPYVCDGKCPPRLKWCPDRRS